ncbi:GGDEF domain-containing protein [Candidatus Methylobacter oryzae]|uniref:diguanylate cyclase n=1 Tax=Candidatus Methylobacter oryzae TaxID=2497749 RepID=A0ABY3CH44_9GAMM|nr:GGDEF domain-containing protein [Candidatus Methylobacter oryzae]TRX00518.1 diguanylate cyclase [Candidatus Methylobacter oryzae]
MKINDLTFLPQYDDKLEQNAEYLRQILPFMSKNKIATNPLNFAIFYEYILGRNIDLNNDLDEILAKQDDFTTELSVALFKKYICDTSIDSLERINHVLLQLINKTGDIINTTGEQANAATIDFQNHSKKLENNQNLAEIKIVLAEIIVGTQGLAETSMALKAQLDESKKEMQRLRQELAQVRETAKTDALTGLLNRRAFDQKLNEFVETHQHNALDLCLLILDIDHFKQVNDTFGHQMGDNVLRYTANLMKHHINEQHYAARYGGEEMAIIMPDTQINTALEVAENIRTSLSQYPLKLKGSKKSIGTVTISIGVSCFKINDTVESLIERADRAMYRAKENGRNQVMSENFI